MRISDWSSDVCSSDLPINWRLSGGEVAYLLGDSGARILFADEASLSLAEMAAEASGGEAPIVLLDRAEGDGAFLSWLGSASEADPGLDISATSVALQLYTSGTTGKPKGAMLSHHSLNRVRLSPPADRKSVVSGKRVAVRVDLGGGRIIKK